MQKILIIISTYEKSGPINIILNILHEIDRNKFSPIVLSLSDESKTKLSAYKEFRDLNIDVHSLKLTRFGGFLFGKSHISKFCREMKIDTIHLVGFRADLIVRGNVFSKYNIISSIFSNIFDDYTMLYGKRKGLIMAYLHMYTLKNKTLVACSEFVKTELNKKTNRNFNVIPNAVSKNKFTIPTDEIKQNIRQQLKIPENKKIFIFVGVLIKRKDPLTAIKGFINSQMEKDGYLIILGDGPLMPECKRIAEGNDNILFMGNTSETLYYLQGADYYISTSHSEGLPTSVVEALGCGLPTILSDIAPHNEILNLIKVSKYLFPVGDFMRLSSQIDEIIIKDYKTLSKNYREAVELTLNSEIMSSQYQSLYSNSNTKLNT